eukprot:CAMPEP_0203881554 /NCGR_PEP_ID=MMETSP0359-20131031/25846_1 /ASSEMBLY_ACC=CAM_ASM_000338 /TAXON_ID=268821 /ORGANISM="Scrippsiella Hangoei, Strain SHTV-5" /LENGTH=531 /DNA_ID=CAMNT_0050801403 /DNA_START=31 /DNA_END=1626 /DNA_ORIENTATION=+
MATTTAPIALVYYFSGPWADCTPACGYGFRAREVYCARTCSLYRCPHAPDPGECSNFTAPISSEACTDLPTCPPATSSTAPPPGTTGLAGVGTSRTTTVLLSGGGSVTSDLYECEVLVGGGSSPSYCLASFVGLCEAGCPCCREWASSSPPVVTQPTITTGSRSQTDTGVPTEETSSFPSWTITLVVASVCAASLLISIAYCVLRTVRRVGKAPPVASKPPPAFANRFASGRRLSQGQREVPEAWASWDEEAWQEPVHCFVESPSAGSSTQSTSAAGPQTFGRPSASTAASAGAASAAGDNGLPRAGKASSGTSGGDSPSRASRRSPSRSATAVPGRQPGAACEEPPPDPQRSKSEGAGFSKPEARSSAGGAAADGGEAGKSKRSRAPGSDERPGQAQRPPSSSSQRPSSEPPGARADGRASGNAGASSSTSAPGGDAKAEGEGSGSGSTTASPKAAVDDGGDPVVAKIIAKIGDELDKTASKDVEWRRLHFKGLMLRWHPDKNRTETPEQAAAVFRHLMDRRDRYLEAMA